jgi:hypothetical protein
MEGGCHAIGRGVEVLEALHHLTEREPVGGKSREAQMKIRFYSPNARTARINFGSIFQVLFSQSRLAEKIVRFAECPQTFRMVWIRRHGVQKALLGFVPLGEVDVDLSLHVQHEV